MSIESILRGIIGIVLIFGIAYLMSNNRKNISWKIVGYGLGLQFVFAVFIFKGDAMGEYFAPLGWPMDLFRYISSFFVLILDFTEHGSEFVFGVLALPPSNEKSIGMVFAFQVLPTIIFFASLMSIFYYLGIMQRIVKGMAWVMQRLLGTSGAESLSCTANIFIGQTEAPLMIKPFISTMTRSELLTIMTGGMATIAGGVMAAYIQILAGSFAQSMNIPVDQAKLMFATHLLGASILAAPAALMISKVIYPETGQPVTKGAVRITIEKNAANFIEAAANGASEGIKLAINVAGMLLAFIALIYAFNYVLEGIGDLTGLNSILMEAYNQKLNFELIIGWALRFLAYGIGVPWQDSLYFGDLFGTKIVLNEFVAYLNLGQDIANNVFTSQKSVIMATYALCGFANFSSIAIQLGGLGPLAPERKSDLSQLGIRAVIGGSLSTLLTATLAGLFY